ncbi:Dihydrolipoyllysine-residue acetyltransferase [Bertholletia excelsa]
MPALSSTMTEGKIVSWIKSEVEALSKGESVVVVESHKADMDVETFYDGILAAIVVGEGEIAPVGAPIGLLAETEEEVAEAKAKALAAGFLHPIHCSSSATAVLGCSFSNSTS